MSFARTPRATTLRGVSWSVLSVSGVATGASLRPFTVTVRFTELPLVVPSFTVYCTLVVSVSPESSASNSQFGLKL